MYFQNKRYIYSINLYNTNSLTYKHICETEAEVTPGLTKENVQTCELGCGTQKGQHFESCRDQFQIVLLETVATKHLNEKSSKLSFYSIMFEVITLICAIF